eukprot:CAMPEP_0113899734 /NCGR_PEP_ID=MMETSP0780_2-20120614/20231_1 /TAXON_ID=652834 /ORGANISM="Palpitomonas bilix" /LENGTH=281 /DNA_ID=CAMNT_0000892005 /DNA_START=207 /DNA_END=1052 /DNA_ORIENTATION=+ /assembly_acc=CAM_ASM_000599
MVVSLFKRWIDGVRNPSRKEKRNSSTEREEERVNGGADSSEVEKFRAVALTWWDPQGPFAGLRAMNEVRVRFLRDTVTHIMPAQTCDNVLPLKGLRVLDVGCGGGLLSEELAKMGADVLGIDAVEESIFAAKQHVSHNAELKEKVVYRCCLTNNLLDEQTDAFDIVIASEVIEHVPNRDGFVDDLSKLCRKGGIVLITTINRTVRSYLEAIIGAEYILRIIDKGTHRWDWFVKPGEVEKSFEKYDIKLLALQGTTYDPFFTRRWSYVNRTDVNFMMAGLKL